MSTKLEQLAQLSHEELVARLMNAENSTRKVAKLTLKVGAKGGISVYGMGRFPVSLYASQWERLGAELFATGALTQFIADNQAVLARKDVAAE